MIKVLLISSSLKNKGGITSVIKGYLSLSQKEVKFSHLSSHKDGGGLIKVLYFLRACFLLPIKLCFQKFDVVHIHVSERGSLWRKYYLYKICRVFKKKVILHHHGAEFLDWYQLLTPKKQKKAEWFLRNVSANIVLSQLLKSKYCRIFHIENVCVVYNGILAPQCEKYKAEERDIILFLGRIGKRKGAYDLLEAIKELVLPEKYKVYFCGDGEVENMQRLVSVYGLEDRVVVKSWIAGKEKEDILNRTLINVLPSYNEGLPMTILETMSRGIPNISTNIASIPEVIENGENGILITPGDIVELSRIIQMMTMDMKFCNQLSDMAIQKIHSSFLLGKTIEELKNIY